MLSLARYRREIADARARIAGTPSQLTTIGLGSIEYLAYGEGPPVLLAHGVVGGCDQAPFVAGAFFGSGFRVVAPSRFGYLRSTAPPDSSPAAQADAYVSLLDELRISKVAVVGTSAGTSSSLQFAIRHPDRCVALILFSMAVPPYPVPPTLALRIMRMYFGSDLLFWCTLQIEWLRLRLLGIPTAVVARSAADDKGFVSRLVVQLLPGSLRVDGILNDIAVSNPGLNEPYALAQITVPTLIFHAKDDRWGSFEDARQIAARIPGAHFRAIESGGHMLLGHRDVVGAEIAAFVRGHSAS